MTSVCAGKCGAGSSARGQVGAGVGGLQGHSLLLSKQAPEPTERMPGACVRSVISLVQVKPVGLAGWFLPTAFSWRRRQMAGVWPGVYRRG